MDFRLTLRLSNDHSVVSMLEENREVWFGLFKSFVRRQIQIYVEEKREEEDHPDAELFTEQLPINAFPLTPDGSSLWERQDLAPWLQVVPLPAAESETDIGEEDRLVRQVQIDLQLDPEISMRNTCMVLSCLLQYSPEELDTPYHLYTLRRLILKEIVTELQLNASVEFDRTHWDDLMQEWLLMPRNAYHCHQGASAQDEECWSSRTTAGAEHIVHDFGAPYHGRSAGILLTSAKGSGKSVFALDCIATLRKVAPWMVTIVKRSGHVIDHIRRESIRQRRESAAVTEFRLGASALGGEETPTTATTTVEDEWEEREEYFEGGNFIDEPTSPSLESAPRPPGDANTLSEFFKMLKSHSQPGRMVVTFIDNIDHFAAGKVAKRLLSQLGIEICNATFEFFMITAGSSSILPTYDSNDYNKNLLELRHFRSIKLYDLPLARAFDFIKRYVENPPSLTFSQEVMEAVAACARRPLTISAEKRRQLEHYLHNMKTSDLKKVSLQVSLRLAKYFQRNTQEIDDMRNIDYCSVLEQVLNSTNFLTGLAPEVVSSLEWVRHDMNSMPRIQQIAEKIHYKAEYEQQYVFFVQLITETEDVEDTKLKAQQQEQDRPFRIPYNASQSLLHRLHLLFNFRSSFFLRAPAQLLPHDAFHSALMPFTAANPFNGFYWHHRNACLVINDLDTVIGYHGKLTEDGMDFEGRGTHWQDVSNHGYTVGRGYSSALTLYSTNPYSRVEGTSEANAITTGSSKGGNVMFRASATGVGAGAGVDLMWDEAKTTGQTFSNSISKGTGVNPILRLLKTYRSGESAGRARGLGEISRHGQQQTRAIRHLYQHPEALAKLIRGLRVVREVSVRDIEALNNVVIVFYKSEACAKELIENRLGWNPDGSYDPPRVGCSHYKRHLMVKAPCCGRWVDCEHCHDALFHRADNNTNTNTNTNTSSSSSQGATTTNLPSESHPTTNTNTNDRRHKMNPRHVTTVKCLYCFTPQTIDRSASSTTYPFSNGIECCECGRHFARAACVPCRVWRNSDRYVRDMKHCTQCDRCYPGHYFDFHSQLCEQPAGR